MGSQVMDTGLNSTPDNRESKFYTYNLDNIMKNLIAGEVHARELDEDRDLGHDSCLRKHLLMTENEFDELQSHTLEVNPENMGDFGRLKRRTEELRHNLNDMGTGEIVREVRSIRKEMEKFNPEYDTSKCESCYDPTTCDVPVGA